MATGGAVCPSVGTSLTFSDTAVNGTLPTLPDQGMVELTITGVYGVGSSTSVTSTATITPPAGVTESNQATNTSTVNTTLITDAKLIVGKSHTASGDTVTYTITLRNEGNAAAHGARFRDYLYSSGTYSAASRATVEANFVSCSAEGGAACPANDQFGSFSGVKGVASRYLFDTQVPLLPAGGSLTVRYTARIQPDVDTCGSITGELRNYVSITPPTGITNTIGTASTYDPITVTGTAACAGLPGFGVVTKSQALLDGTPISNAAPLPFGTPIRYTITATNTTGVDVNGAQIRDYTGHSGSTNASYRSKLDARLVSCVAENGAVCPDAALFTPISRGGGMTSSSSSNQGNIFNTTIPVFPANGKITITYEAVFSPSEYCGIPSGVFYNSAQLMPPDGIGYAASTSTQVSVRLPENTACPDVQVTKTQSTDAAQPGVPYEYEVVITNNGPGDADNTKWNDYLHPVSTSGFEANLKAKVEYLACTPAGGAECPAVSAFKQWDSVLLSGTRYLVENNTLIPRLPAGSSITLRYKVTLEALDAASCRSASGSIRNTTGVTAPNALSAKNASVTMPLVCADVGISKTVDPIVVQPGNEVTYTVFVSNSGLGAAAGVVMTDPLPAYFNYTSASCETVKPSITGAATTCGSDLSYDPVTHTVRSTIENIGMLGEVKFTIRGTAGVFPGTHKNSASLTLPPGMIDPILVTNMSDVNVQLQNTSSPITVVKQVTGLPAAGLPEPATFNGTVTCGTQPSQTWTLTIPAGATSASSAPLTFYDTQVCTVTENTPPSPPNGYAWVGTPVIDNSADPLGPNSPRTVTVTNALRRLAANVSLIKLIDGPAAAVSKVDGNFDFALDCGADGNFSGQITISGGNSASTTVAGIPTGATCKVSETGRADPPSGFVWDDPSFDINPVVVPDQEGGVVEVRVTNTLKNSAVAKVPAMDFIGLGLLGCLLAVAGLSRRRVAAMH